MPSKSQGNGPFGLSLWWNNHALASRRPAKKAWYHRTCGPIHGGHGTLDRVRCPFAQPAGAPGGPGDVRCVRKEPERLVLRMRLLCAAEGGLRHRELPLGKMGTGAAGGPRLRRLRRIKNRPEGRTGGLVMLREETSGANARAWSYGREVLKNAGEADSFMVMPPVSTIRAQSVLSETPTPHHLPATTRALAPGAGPELGPVGAMASAPGGAEAAGLEGAGGPALPFSV